MRIVIEIDETQVTPQGLKALRNYVDARGTDEIQTALADLSRKVEVGVEKAKRNGTYLQTR